jgi:hypothetical protein
LGRLQLKFDAARLEFLARVIVQVAPHRWVTVELVLDSGSNATGLHAGVARRSGVEPGLLPREDLDFVASRAQIPYLEGVRLVFAGDTMHTPVEARLAILPDPREGSGGGEAAGVLGLDVLKDLGARVVLDLGRAGGFVDW